MGMVRLVLVDTVESQEPVAAAGQEMVQAVKAEESKDQAVLDLVVVLAEAGKAVQRVLDLGNQVMVDRRAAG